MKAWVHQDGKQVKKHGTDKCSWYVSWTDESGRRRCKSCGPGEPGRTEAARLRDMIVRFGQDGCVNLMIQECDVRKHPVATVTEEEIDRLKVANVVYFVEAVGLERVKIGLTRNIRNRLLHLQLACPVRLRVVGIIPGTRKLERSLHRRFAAVRIHSEWFQLTVALRMELHRLKEKERLLAAKLRVASPTADPVRVEDIAPDELSQVIFG